MEGNQPLPLGRRSHPPHRKGNGNARGGVATFIIAAAMITLLILGALMATVVTVGAAATASFYHSFTEDLPSIGEMGVRDTFKTTRILDRNGDLLYELLDQSGGKRTTVRLNDLPPVILNAVLAAEDASFYDNPGI